MENEKQPTLDDMQQIVDDFEAKRPEAYWPDGIKVMKNSMLPPGTMMVSEDLFNALQRGGQIKQADQLAGNTASTGDGGQRSGSASSNDAAVVIAPSRPSTALPDLCPKNMGICFSPNICQEAKKCGKNDAPL